MGVTVYTVPHCPQCDATARALTRAGIPFTMVDVTVDREALDTVRAFGYVSAPVVITTGGDHWSGYRPDMVRQLASTFAGQVTDRQER